MKPATNLIHTGERIDTGATPSLTVPIYETSTFVFDSVADVIKYQEGKLNGYLYSRYENPTVVAVEQKVAAVDGAEAALLFSSGMAAISTALLTLLKPGDEILCSAAIYGGTFHIIEDLMAKFGVERRFITLDDLANLSRRDRPEDQDGVVRVADQSDAAMRRRAGGGGGVQEGRRALGDRQHVCQCAQPAGAVDGHRPVDAERHQVSQWPQRRHRRRAVWLEGDDRAARQGAPPARRHHGSAAGLRARPRHEDHAAARRAAQRQRAGRGAALRGPSRPGARLLSRASPRTRITPLPRAR